MSRIARIVIPGIPHHLVQRGNRRQQVFFNDKDFRYYLNLLKRYGREFGLTFWVYCMMSNHLHLICVPQTEKSLAEVMAVVNWKYAMRINRREGWNGHLWQSRFYSCPLDHPHLIASARYIERNPVRAKIVDLAEDYPWSSARVHVEKKPDPLIEPCPLVEEFHDWKAFINEEESADSLKLLRKHFRTGRPLGDDAFIERLELMTGQSLKKQKPGPKPREGDSGSSLLFS